MKRQELKEMCWTMAETLVSIEDKDLMNQQAAKYLEEVMNKCLPEDTITVAKTWLVDYQISLMPVKMGKVFDRFHAECGHLVTDHAEKGKNFDSFKRRELHE